MNIEKVSEVNDSLMIKLIGEMDAHGCSKIRPQLEQITSQDQSHVILDISLVNFIDSSGIGAIVFLFKRLKEQSRSMELIGVQGQPKELMTLLRMDSAISMQCAPDSEAMQCTH